MTFHLKSGIMFTGNSKIGMAPREVVASDVAACFNRVKVTPGPSGFFKFINTITATDKYTVVLALASYSANWNFYFGGGMNMGAIQPPEMTAANTPVENWQNSVGTGPFILTDFVSGAGATYTRNPNYWGKTTINGKEYQLPFISKLIYPIIPDESTQIAAVRTGKIDWDPYVKMPNLGTLTQTSPTLIIDKYLYGKVDIFKINRLASKTLNSVKVRQAMMVGTDFQAISTLLYNGGPILSFPIGPQVPGYTTLAQLPAADQALFNYSATTSKQLLASAGYPNGFSVELWVDNADSLHTDLCSAVAAQWAKIGVTANIKVIDTAALSTANNTASYPDFEYNNTTVVNPLTVLNLVDGNRIGPTYLTTEPFQAMFNQMSAETNATTRTADIKALSVAMLDDVTVIPFAQPYRLNCHWPWLKNYFGELDAGYYNQMPMIKQMWIDKSN
jgi:peptide/nickel transport system substrate-binding protein